MSQETLQSDPTGDLQSRWAGPLVLALIATLVGMLIGQVSGEPLEKLSLAGDWMASSYLLLSLGFLVVLCCRAVDVSVWALGGLGGVAAAGLINAGFPPALSLTLAAVSGAAVGLVSGVLVARFRWPGWVASAVVAIALVAAMRSVIRQPSIAVPDDTFDTWRLVAQIPVPSGTPEAGAETGSQAIRFGAPLEVTRRLIVAGLFVLTLLGLLQAGARSTQGRCWPRRRTLVAAFMLSGFLSASGGALWLMDFGAAPVLTRPIGDLRVPVAALLAGGLLLRGANRAALAAVSLLGALLAVDLWRQGVYIYLAGGYAMHVALLGAMLVVAHASLSLALRRGGLAVLWSVPAAAGLLLAAAASGPSASAGRAPFLLAGISLAVVAAAGTIVSRRRARSRSPN